MLPTARFRRYPSPWPKRQMALYAVSLTNVNLDKAKTVELALDGASSQSVTGEILTAKNMDDYNDFNHPEVVRRTAFKDSKTKKRKIRLKVPAMSVVVINVR